MFNTIISILRPKKKSKTQDKSNEIAGFILAFDNIQDFKNQHNLTCAARTTGELIRYLESCPNQKWYGFKSARKKHIPSTWAFMRSSLPLMMPWNGMRPTAEGSILSNISHWGNASLGIMSSMIKSRKRKKNL